MYTLLLYWIAIKYIVVHVKQNRITSFYVLIDMLLAVDPVVQGQTRAEQFYSQDKEVSLFDNSKAVFSQIVVPWHSPTL